ncbi:MAG: CCA tRNA nucleotidyltransferase [Bryobacterales bacterium]|nr:CCA tRNA nucleotidyltransferase [Bryobacterales bacterium]MDE0622230.1 CCA tRNA nucleotidyltransferase [Bryobacterales bacterium]
MSLQVIQRLQSNGFKAYWVGGCVRDELLGRPIKDRDVATDARPEQVVRLFKRARRAGQRFGVVQVRDDDGFTEVATFRREGPYSDGRRPDNVSYTNDPKQDAIRRDFTVNAMFFDPVSNRRLDFTGGAADLENRLIRAVGSAAERFREDHLRMLRAVRLAASLGFEIEAGTMAAIRDHAAAMRSVAAERVRDELGRILTEGSARRGFELLRQSGLLEQLLPEVAALSGVEQPPQYHPEGDVWTHTMLMLDGLQRPSLALAWGVLLHDVGKPETFTRADRIRFHGHVERGLELAESICKRLRFSNATRERVLALVANHMKFAHVRDMRRSRLRRFVEQPDFDDHLELHRLDCVSSHGQLDNHEFARQHHEQVQAEEPFVPLLTGRDLIAAGYEPGPVFGKVLAEVRELQHEGVLADREQALAFARGRVAALR